jgi:hypothetical protein
MKTILLAAGAAALVLSAGPTLAAAKHAATAAGPKQPIPYSQLSAYMKASPKQRMSKDWWSGQTSVAANAAPVPTAGADTGAAASTSATTATPSPSLPGDTPSAPAPAPSAAPSLPATPPVDNPPSTAVNPPATATPGAPPAATPPK